MKRALVLTVLAAACLWACGGCTGRVVRTITVESEPQGARVWLNDNEVGRTPVTVPFTWYGVYRVRLEKEGYKVLTAYERVAAPWYQWVGPDLLFETVIPGTRYDRHVFEPYELEVARPADPEPLLARGEAFRQEAIKGFSEAPAAAAASEAPDGTEPATPASSSGEAGKATKPTEAPQEPVMGLDPVVKPDKTDAKGAVKTESQ